MDYTTQSCGDSPKKTLSESLSNKQDSMESSFFSWLKSASRLQADRRKSAKKKKHKKDKAVREMFRKSCSVLPINRDVEKAVSVAVSLAVGYAWIDSQTIPVWGATCPNPSS